MVGVGCVGLASLFLLNAFMSFGRLVEAALLTLASVSAFWRSQTTLPTYVSTLPFPTHSLADPACRVLAGQRHRPSRRRRPQLFPPRRPGSIHVILPLSSGPRSLLLLLLSVIGLAVRLKEVCCPFQASRKRVSSLEFSSGCRFRSPLSRSSSFSRRFGTFAGLLHALAGARNAATIRLSPVRDPCTAPPPNPHLLLRLFPPPPLKWALRAYGCLQGMTCYRQVKRVEAADCPHPLPRSSLLLPVPVPHLPSSKLLHSSPHPTRQKRRTGGKEEKRNERRLRRQRPCMK